MAKRKAASSEPNTDDDSTRESKEPINSHNDSNNNSSEKMNEHWVADGERNGASNDHDEALDNNSQDTNRTEDDGDGENEEGDEEEDEDVVSDERSFVEDLSYLSDSAPAQERFVHAAKRGDVDDMKELLAEVDINGCNEQDSTALIMACDHGNLEVVRFLVSQPNIDLNKCTEEHGSLALCVALQGHRGEILEFLLEQPSINVNAYNGMGDAVLHFACSHGYWILTQQCLAKHPALNWNLPNEHTGITPLQAAVGWKKDMMVRYLLYERGIEKDTMNSQRRQLYSPHIVDVNATSNSGNTALHMLLKNWGEPQHRNKSEDWDILQLLLQHPKLNLYVKNNKWETPWDLLPKEENADIRRALDLAEMKQQAQLLERWSQQTLDKSLSASHHAKDDVQNKHDQERRLVVVMTQAFGFVAAWLSSSIVYDD